MKTFLRTVILFVALLLQITVISQFHFFGAIPNFFLVVLLYTLSVSDMKYAISVGTAFGVLFDFLTGKVFGIHTALCLLFAILVCYVSNNIRDKKLPYYLIATLLFTGLYEYLTSVLLISETPSVTLRWAFIHKVLPTALSNTLWMLPVYYVFGRFLKNFYQERKQPQ